MITRLCLLFAAGVVSDLLITYYTRSVAEKKFWHATILSGVITITSFMLFFYIIESLNMAVDIVTYATGNMAGTGLAMRGRYVK